MISLISLMEAKYVNNNFRGMSNYLHVGCMIDLLTRNKSSIALLKNDVFHK